MQRCGVPSNAGYGSPRPGLRPPASTSAVTRDREGLPELRAHPRMTSMPGGPRTASPWTCGDIPSGPCRIRGRIEQRSRGSEIMGGPSDADVEDLIRTYAVPRRLREARVAERLASTPGAATTVACRWGAMASSERGANGARRRRRYRTADLAPRRSFRHGATTWSMADDCRAPDTTDSPNVAPTIG